MSKGIVISHTRMNKLLKLYGPESEGSGSPVKRLGNQCPPKVPTKSLIAEVKRAILIPNPPSQRKLARKFRTSQYTISKIIHRNLEAKVRKKGKVHALSNKQAEQRASRGPRLAKFLSQRNLLYIILIDELKNHKVLLLSPKLLYRGPTVIRFISPTAKITADFYIQNVSKPLMREDFRRLCPSEERKVVLHQDPVPAHTPKKTCQRLASPGIRYIPKGMWPSNSPDFASMDFGTNGIFKRILYHKHATSIRSLLTVARPSLYRISITLSHQIIRAWRYRVVLMAEKKGFQIEQILK
ncbi:uncharacterized protein LOC129598885 [Paramacrobiotus metropolitanus]|uniref:uncharacterized protein LOC129598885 n=1 Tax=Paramacrobiotus metropolitanus TaxID=2943436 RepID=UPI00244568D2|nr:uncharacterized protein LOC129598885 [Paramacrobiotus metropolitanus]